MSAVLTPSSRGFPGCTTENWVSRRQTRGARYYRDAFRRMRRTIKNFTYTFTCTTTVPRRHLIVVSKVSRDPRGMGRYSVSQSVMSDDAATRPRSPNLRPKAQNKGRLRWAAPPGHPQLEVLSTSSTLAPQPGAAAARRADVFQLSLLCFIDGRRPLPSIRGMESVCPDRYVYHINSAAIGLIVH